MFCTRAPVSGSWVVGPRGRGFFHGSVYRRRKRRRWPWGFQKTEMGSKEYVWQWPQCACCQPKKIWGAGVQSKAVLSLAAEDLIDDPARLFIQGGLGAAACQPSVPARLQPKQLSTGTHSDACSQFGRRGEAGKRGVAQSCVSRRIISVNEFLFSSKSCDWLHQTPLADKIWRAQYKKCMCYAEPYLSYCSPTCSTPCVPLTSFKLY